MKTQSQLFGKELKTLLVPVLCLIMGALSPNAQATPAIQSAQTSGAVVETISDFTGGSQGATVGWSFKTGKSPIVVTRLGIYDADGNGLANQHEVGIWDSSGKRLISTTLGARTSNILEGAYRYTPIGGLKLAANTTYVIGAFYPANSSDQFIASSSQTFAPALSYGSSRSSQAGTTLAYPSQNAEVDQGIFGPTFDYNVVQSGPNFVVNKTDEHDDGECSASDCTLREAIAAANSDRNASVITFSPSVFKGKVTLSGKGLPAITTDMSINGPTAPGSGVTLSGDGLFAVSNATASFSNLTLSDTSVDAIFIEDKTSHVTVDSCTFLNDNIGVQNGGYATINNCTFVGSTNTAIFNGGNGLQATTHVNSCTVTGSTYGVAIESGAIAIANSIIVDNSTNLRKAAGTLTRDSNSIVSGTAAAAGLDPNGLQDNGGPTATIALVRRGRAVDTGNTALLTDQRAVARPQRSAPDVGAFELQNAAPSVSSVTVTPTTPKTNDKLTAKVGATDADGDALTISYQWLKNGVEIPDEVAATLDLKKSGNGDKDDKISVVATVTDPFGGATKVTSQAVTIVNTPPMLSRITITPNRPRTNDKLTVLVGTLSDADNDTISLAYQWYKNGTPLPDETSVSLDLAKAGHGDKDDKINVQISASDGTTTTTALSSTVTVLNSAPVINTLTLTPTSPRTDDPITATAVGSDLDNDAFTYTYVWTRVRNGKSEVVKTTTDSKNSTDTLPTRGAVISVGDVVKVNVVLSDGTDSSASKTASVTIANTPLSLTRINLKPATPLTGALVIADVRVTDTDGTRPGLTYVWKKTHQEKTTVIRTTRSDQSQDTYDLSLPNYGNKGDVITLTVTASDGQSNATLSQSVTVGNTIPKMTDIALSPQAPTPTSLVRATAKASDIDATEHIDTLTYSYNWRIGTRLLTGETTSNLDLSKYSFVKQGDVVSVEVRASDGTSLSAAQTASVIVGDASTSPSAGSA